MSIDGGLGNIADITGLALFLVSPKARRTAGTPGSINGGIISPVNSQVEWWRKQASGICASRSMAG